MIAGVPRAVAVLALLGATLGVALDGWHVATGTTWYAAPWHFGIATWTVPLFASAGALVGVVPVLVERALGQRVAPVSRAGVVAPLALFVLAYLVSGVLRGALCAVALSGLAVAIYLAGDRPPLGVALAHALGAGAGGALVEMTLVHFGAFFHADGSFFGVAPWLPLLYVCASLGLTPLARALALSPAAAAVASPG